MRYKEKRDTQKLKIEIITLKARVLAVTSPQMEERSGETSVGFRSNSCEGDAEEYHFVNVKTKVQIPNQANISSWIVRGDRLEMKKVSWRSVQRTILERFLQKWNEIEEDRTHRGGRCRCDHTGTGRKVYVSDYQVDERDGTSA